MSELTPSPPVEGDPFDRLYEAQRRREEPATHWQGRRIDQLGFSNNLLIALALALIAFVGPVLLSETPYAVRFVPLGLLVALLASACSVGVGVAIALNRLRDFRVEADRERGYKVVDGKREHVRPEELIDASRRIGATTWRLLSIQLGTWLLGVVMFLLAILLYVASRLR